MTPTDHAVAAMLDTFRRAPIERDYADPDLRAALGSSPPLEKMKMDKFDRERAEQSLEDEREATQALISELVKALTNSIHALEYCLVVIDDGDLLKQKVRVTQKAGMDLLARAKASHGAGT